MTITIQIGNTDNKLTQQKWSQFIKSINEQLLHHAINVHFAGGSNYDQQWQNACWVIEISPEIEPGLKLSLSLLKLHFDQHSIAYTIGATQLL